MRVFLGADHAGFELKEHIKSFLAKNNYQIEDCGAFEFNKDDDYPDFISKVAKCISADPQNSRGIIFGGSGQAEMMLANKFKNVRCSLFYAALPPVQAADITGRKSIDEYEIIRLTREHNDSNMLSLGARFITFDQAIQAVELWLKTPFPADERHVRRINKIKEIEQNEFK